MNGNQPSHDPGRDAKNVAAALRRRERAQLIRQWLRPGIGIKRWLVVAFVGLLLIALAGAAVLRLVLADRPVADPLHDIIATLTLQVAARRVALAAAFGVWPGALRVRQLAPGAGTCRALPRVAGAARRVALSAPAACSRTQGGGDRRRDRSVVAVARPQGGDQQHHRRRHGGRRRWLPGSCARVGHSAGGRHPPVHCGVGR